MNREQHLHNSHLTDPRLGRVGFTGIAFGALSLLACELPFILTFVGLGGLGTVASVFKPHPLVEGAGIAAAITGVVLLVTLALLRRCRNKGRVFP